MLKPGNHQIIGAREQQEDYFVSFESKSVAFAAVADGMGGHVGGECASELALKAFRETLQKTKLTHITTDMGTALDAANQTLTDAQAIRPEIQGMGTTLVALALQDQRVYWISVGDSPLYRLRGRRLERLNANHAVAASFEQSVAAGEMTAQQAREDPDYHALTSALTGAPIPLIDCPADGIPLQTGDRFLLASDGIHSLSEAEIQRLLYRHRQPQRAAEALIQSVEKKRVPDQDNCSVVTVFTQRQSRYGLVLTVLMVLAILLALGVYTLYTFYPTMLSDWLPKPETTLDSSTPMPPVKKAPPQPTPESPSAPAPKDQSPQAPPEDATAPAKPAIKPAPPHPQEVKPKAAPEQPATIEKQ